MPEMILHHKEYGAGRPLIVLHGLFGSLDNWSTLGRRFGDHFRVITVDQRNHGHSFHADEMDYAVMADDLRQLLDHLEVDKAHILGHSMGGKTAMKFAMEHEDRVDQLIVADISPRAYSHHHQSVLDALFALYDAPLLDSRRSAETIVAEYIDEPGVRFFLLKNLYWKEKGRLALRVNLPVIAAHMDEIIASIGEEMVTLPTLFLSGSESDYIGEEDIGRIGLQFLDSEVVELPEAGHWLHAQQPDLFYDEVVRFLDF